jgi:Protein of unknown function (DUF732)
MMRTGWQRIVAGAVTAVAPLAVTLALSVALAPAASADPWQDKEYADGLAAVGITFSSARAAGDLGLAICAELRRGYPLSQTFQRLAAGGMTQKQQQAAVWNANFIYCPYALVNPG